MTLVNRPIPTTTNGVVINTNNSSTNASRNVISNRHGNTTAATTTTTTSTEYEQHQKVGEDSNAKSNESKKNLRFFGSSSIYQRAKLFLQIHLFSDNNTSTSKSRSLSRLMIVIGIILLLLGGLCGLLYYLLSLVPIGQGGEGQRKRSSLVPPPHSFLPPNSKKDFRLQQVLLQDRKEITTDWLNKPRIVRLVVGEYVVPTSKDNQNKKKHKHHKTKEENPRLEQSMYLTKVSPIYNYKFYKHNEFDDTPESNILFKNPLQKMKEIPQIDEGCEPMEDWQVGHQPTCTFIHEIDMTNMVQKHDYDIVNENNRNHGIIDKKYEKFPYHFQIIGNGAYRDVWVIKDNDGKTKRVLKTLRIADGNKRVFDLKSFDRHRRDALAFDQLTFSPYVVDTYGYCTNSAIFKLGEGGTLNDYYSKKRKKKDGEALSHKFSKNKDGELVSVADGKSLSSFLKHRTEDEENDGPSILHRIETTYNISMSIAHTHKPSSKTGLATIAHTDIKPDQFLYEDGYYKLTDFNRARLLPYRPSNNSICGFKVAANRGSFRSPEEYKYERETHKVDVFSLGNMIYYLLTKQYPWRNVKSSKDVPNLVIAGQQPKLPRRLKTKMINDDKLHMMKSELFATFPTNKNIINTTMEERYIEGIFMKYMIEAMQMCFVYDPIQRPNAQDVANKLQVGIIEIKSYYRHKNEKQI